MASKRQQRRAHRLNACYGKVAYDTPEAAVEALGRDKTRVSYHCGHCGKYHNGHPMLRPNQTEKRHKGEIVGTHQGLKKAFAARTAAATSTSTESDAKDKGAAARRHLERRYKQRRPITLYWLGELARWADDGGAVLPDEDVMYGPGSMGFEWRDWLEGGAWQ